MTDLVFPGPEEDQNVHLFKTKLCIYQESQEMFPEQIYAVITGRVKTM